MKLSIQAIKEFQQIYKEEYKKEISLEEAEVMAINFLLLMKAIYKPMEIKKDGQPK